MATTCEEELDPRVRRTRSALHCSLASLLKEKEFDKISVQDIAEGAALNRATFYDHYPDKFTLLEAMVGARFNDLLCERNVIFDGGCASALKATVLGVCDYLAAMPRLECERQLEMEPHLESAVISIVRKKILFGLEQHPAASPIAPEMIAATVSWAIYGAAKEWLRTPNRPPSENAADAILALVVPIFSLGNATAA